MYKLKKQNNNNNKKNNAREKIANNTLLCFVFYINIFFRASYDLNMMNSQVCHRKTVIIFSMHTMSIFYSIIRGVLLSKPLPKNSDICLVKL